MKILSLFFFFSGDKFWSIFLINFSEEKKGEFFRSSSVGSGQRPEVSIIICAVLNSSSFELIHPRKRSGS